MAKLFNKTSLISARPQFTDVEVGTLGTVRIKALNTADYYRLQQIATKVDLSNPDKVANPDQETMSVLLYEMYPAIVALAVVNEDLSPVFNGADDPDLLLMRPDDLAALGNAAYAFWGFAAQPSIDATVKN